MRMLLLLHVIIALAGLVFTAVTFFAPSRTRINAAFGFLAATIASGTALVVVLQASMLRACISGLLYTAIIFLGIFAAQRRLSNLEKSN